jgi:hypothetical protein
MVDWSNPYASLGNTWLKGNLHAHTSPQSPCGRVQLKRVLELYEHAGFDFISISDHQHCTSVTVPTRLLIIPGLEWNCRTDTQPSHQVTYQGHLGIYSLHASILQNLANHRYAKDAVNSIQGNNSLVILNHPNWLIPAHYSEEELFELYQFADGMEIYNAVIDRHPGTADATLKWDRVLTEKGPILGFSSDDSHLESDINRAYLMVNVEQATLDNTFSAITAGRFYCSTGVTIHNIGCSGEELFCTADSDIDIDAIGENGQLLASARQEMRIRWAAINSSYVRFTLYGQGKKQAWSQPFFRYLPEQTKP